ncbi:MAG: 16S rRNA (guanine(527)-N(7))-methyltransferase RsmG [Pseudomonadota bacterium]
MPVSDRQAEMMAVHAEELMKWNRKTNLTAITDPADIAIKHFIDSIVPSCRIPDHASLIDIGTGGGFPGIPLKIMRPSISMTLVDSSRKKVNFIKHVIRTLNLEKIEAVHARIEDLAKDPRYQNAFDFAISRAFTELSRFAGLASPFLNPTGQLIAMKSQKGEAELQSIKLSEKQPVIETYRLPFQGAVRTLIILYPPTIPLTQDDNLP